MRPSDERRKSRRQLAADFVQVAWCDQEQKQVSTVGLLEDVSPEGLCLNLELPIPRGATVHIHTKGFEGEAQVRYCELGDYGYLVGLEFVDGSSWDRDKWRPKHLVSLDR